MPLDIKRLEELEQEAQERLDPGSDDYEDMVASLSRLGNVIDTHYKGLRKVDDTGKLTADAPGRQPARVGEGDSDYFFEPNVKEVQEFFKRNPDALDRLRDARGNPLRQWAEGEAQAEIRSPMFDGQTQAITGYNVTPAKSHLDQLQESQEPYKAAADEMWRLASEDATKKGKAVKRYRDVKLDKGEWRDVIEGGIKKGESRIVAPALLGAADAMSAGQASPLYDALKDLGEYRQSRMSPEEQESARSMGYDPTDADSTPSAEEVQNRSMPAYVAGNIAGYSSPYAPGNIAQKVIQEGLNYSSRGLVGRALTGAAAGAGANAYESFMGDTARFANEGDTIPVGESRASRIAKNAATSAGIGFVAGGGFDLAGQGFGAARDAYRGAGRNAPLRTMEGAGAEASMITGVSPTKEIGDVYAQQKKDRLNDKLAPYTPAGKMADELAPQIKQSVTKRSAEQQAATGKQMEEYYAHPAYRDRTVSTRPAVEGLVEMATRGIARGPVSGSMMPMNPSAIDEIGGILRDYSEAVPVDRAESVAMAHSGGGTVVPGELANRLYGLQEGDIGYFAPGQDAVVRPVDINAENLTILEGRIDEELNFAKIRGGKNDPVWKRFNERVKAMRDKFPLYRDADGKLVEPPPPEPEPFAPADDIPREEGRYLAPPTAVRGPTPPKPEGAMAMGPPESFGPPIPRSPFDTRLPTSRESINPKPTMAVRGDYSEPGYIGPEANPGIGPNYQPPNDPRRLGPPIPVQGQFDMGGEYSPPSMVSQPDIPGPGPRRDAPRFSGASPDAVRPAPTIDVTGGEYSQPPRVQPEEPPAVDTPRMPLGMPEQPKSLGDDEYSAMGGLESVGRNPMATSRISEESLQTLAKGPDTPRMESSEDVIPERGESLASFEARGGKTGVELPPEVQAKVDDGTLTNEAQQKDALNKRDPLPETTQGESFAILDKSDETVREKTFATRAEAAAEAKRLGAKFKAEGRFRVKKMESRSPLERSLDAQLDAPDAPRVPKTEIEEAGARQTADREQVASDQKAYVEDIFAPGREARAAQVEKVRALGEHPEVIQEAMEAVKKIDSRIGPISEEQKRAMVISMIEQKLGRKIDAEDLIRFGLISAGLVTMSADDSQGDVSQAGMSIGSILVALGLKGRGGDAEPPKGPSKPAKPTQPEATLDDGRVVRGFSAMRNQQHNDTEAIEKAMKRLGVEGDITLENRIRTYGQLNDRGKVDQALLDEASHIGKQRELRNTAATNAYDELKDRRWGLGNEGFWKGVLDLFGFRLYAASEYLAGRHQRESLPGKDGLYRNPYIKDPTTRLGEMQRTLLEDPARRLLDLTGGGPASRLGGEKLKEFFSDDSEYESKEDYEKKQQKKRNKESHP